MNITKEMVLRLYELKDPKRRRMLFEFYQSHFDQRYSAGFIVEMINADLGKNLITAYDVKYVRAKSRKWLVATPAANATTVKIDNIPDSGHDDLKAGSWSRTEPKPFINPSKKIKL